MLSRLISELLLGLVHIFIAIYESVILEAYEYFKSRNKKCSSQDEPKYLAYKIKSLKRKPEHLVVSVSKDWLNVNELADLALWSLQAGIPFLTFYDLDGHLQHQEDKLFHKVEVRKYGVPGLIKWPQRPSLNGYSNGHKLFMCTVNILTEEHCKPRMVRIARDIMQHIVSPERKGEYYTPEELNPIINSYYDGLPDPDLCTFCGPVCRTGGLIPWKIRLTEFLPLKKYDRVKVEDFVEVLEKFNKCNQRLGK